MNMHCKQQVWLALAIALSTGAVQAADLATAQKQWDNKQFDEAFRNFKVLAEQGNPAAQLQLGEMYGFGEGTSEDVGQAEVWLQKAAAAGQADAKESLVLVRERQKHKDDIASYTRNFTGAQLAYPTYKCVRPVIPAASKTNEDVKKTNEAINTWTECYKTFVTRLNGALPVTNTIPPDIIRLMNNDEFQQASKLIENTLVRLAAEGQTVADQVAVESKTWTTNTIAFAGQTKADKEIFLQEQERLMRSMQSGRLYVPFGK